MQSYTRPSEYFTTSYYHTDHFAVGSLLETGRKTVVGHHPHVDHHHRTLVAHNDHHTPALQGTRGHAHGHVHDSHDAHQGTHQSHLEVGRLVADNHLHADGAVKSNRLQVERLEMERLAADSRL